jgi:AcrR family transcriptional regulator
MPSPARTRGEYAKTEARRREIVEAAFSVFSAMGYQGSSMRAIADRAGMTQPGMTHHFANKDELLAAVLELRDERSFEAFDLIGSSGLESLRGFVRLVEQNQRERELVELHCMLSAEATRSDHPAHTYFQHRYEALIERARASFEALQREGELRDGVDPGVAAVGVIAHVDGLQIQWLLDPSRLDMVASLRAYLRLLVRSEV